MTSFWELAPEVPVPYHFISPAMDGVYLAVNAIPDAYLVYHAHDCGTAKVERITANHDLFSDLIQWRRLGREARTRIDSRDHIIGGEHRLSETIAQVCGRYRPGLVVVALNAIPIVMGEDPRPLLRQLRAQYDAPLVLVSEISMDLDFISGYFAALDAVFDELGTQLAARRDTPDEIDAQKDPHRPLSAFLTGFVCDRLEADCEGNVAELTRLLAGLGVTVEATLLDGTPFSELCQRRTPDLIIDLAADHTTAAAALAKRIGARHLGTALPMGLRGTEEWLLALGEALGRQDQARALVERELSALAPRLQWLAPRYLTGKGVLVFADHLLMPGLAGFLEEFGCHVLGAGETSIALERHPRRGAQPARDRVVASSGPIPMETRRLREFVALKKAQGELDLIIGNSFIRSLIADPLIPYLTLGYPSNHFHVLHPAPFLGFAGVRVLVERIINAFEERAFRHACAARTPSGKEPT